MTGDRKVYEIWDFNGNEVKGVRYENLSTPPLNPSIGRVYFDTAFQKIGVYLIVDSVPVWKYFPGGGVSQVNTYAEFPLVGEKDILYIDLTTYKAYIYDTAYRCLNEGIKSDDTVSEDGEVVIEDGTTGQKVKKSGKKFNNAGMTSSDLWDAEQIINDGYSRFEIKGQQDSLHNLGLLQGNIDDLGRYWTKVPVDVGSPLQCQAVYHVCSLGNGIVLAGSYGGGTSFGAKVFRSTDYGKTFPDTITLESPSQFTTTFQIVYLGQGIVLVGAGNSSVSTNGALWRSVDYGQTFTKIDLGVVLHWTISLCDLGQGVVLLGAGNNNNDGDIWRSTNHGLTWTKIDVDATTIYSIAYLGGEEVLCTTEDSTYRSVDNGLTWNLEIVFPENILCSCYLGGGVVLLGTNSGRLQRSVDYGVTFQTVSVASTSIRFITYAGSGVVFYSTSVQAALYKSTDIGNTWEQVNIPGLTGTLDYALRMCYAGDSVLFLGVGDATLGSAAVYRSSLIERSDFVPPVVTVSYLGTVTSQAEMLALVGTKGDWCIRTDKQQVYNAIAYNLSDINSWQAEPMSIEQIQSLIDGTTHCIIFPITHELVKVITIPEYGTVTVIGEDGVEVGCEKTYNVSGTELTLNFTDYFTGKAIFVGGGFGSTVDFSSLLLKTSNLSDVLDRQIALNNLTNASSASVKQVLTIDELTGNAVFRDVQSLVVSKSNVVVSADPSILTIDASKTRMCFDLTGGTGNGSLAFSNLPTIDSEIYIIIRNNRGSSIITYLPTANIVSGGITYTFYRNTNSINTNNGFMSTIRLTCDVVDSTHIAVNIDVVQYTSKSS